MATRRYKISLRVLKKYFTRSLRSLVEYFFNTSIYYIYTNELPNHFTLIVFWFERRDLLSSHSHGDIFKCEDIKFSSENSPGPGCSNVG